MSDAAVSGITLVVCLLMIWIVFGEPIGKKARAKAALEKRGYCSKHFKRADIHKTDPEHHAGFSVLCEDCIPEWEENERKRLEYLLKVAR